MANGIKLEYTLQQACTEIEESTVESCTIFSRINFDGRCYTSKNFEEMAAVFQRRFQLPDGKIGSIELHLTDSAASANTESTIVEINSSLDIIVPLLIGLISQFRLKTLAFDIGERQKELKGINLTTEILEAGKSLEESLQIICQILPESWQYLNIQLPESASINWFLPVLAFGDFLENGTEI